MKAFGWAQIARVGLVQAALGAVVVLTTSTLNRIMVVELALPALLPGFLVAWHYAVQMVRPRMGFGADKGRRSTPWMMGGMLVLGGGGFLFVILVFAFLIRLYRRASKETAFVRTGILEKLALNGMLDPERVSVVEPQTHPGFRLQSSTRLYPEWPVFALPHVDERVVRRVASALYALEPENPAVRAAGIHGYTTPADYLPLENMASNAARTAACPTIRGPPGCTQTMSSSSAQQAMRRSRSPFCRAS